MNALDSKCSSWDKVAKVKGDKCERESACGFRRMNIKVEI